MPPPAIQMREAVRVVVAAEELRAAARLVHRRAAELAAPDDERVVEQAALLEVLEQRGDRPVDLACTSWAGRRRCRRPVPVPWMSQPQSKSCTKRTPCSTSRRASRQLLANDASPGFAPYASRTCFGSLRDVHHLGHGHLHAEGQLVLAMRVSVSGSPNSLQLELVELAAARRGCGGGRRGPCPCGLLTYRIGSPVGAALHALKDRRQEAAAPERSCRRSGRCRR